MLAEGLTDPSRFLTLHWSNPAPFIPGVEIVAGERTDLSFIPVVKPMLERAGRRSAQIADVPSFVLNRLQYVLLEEAMSIVEENCRGSISALGRSSTGAYAEDAARLQLFKDLREQHTGWVQRIHAILLQHGDPAFTGGLLSLDNRRRLGAGEGLSPAGR